MLVSILQLQETNTKRNGAEEGEGRRGREGKGVSDGLSLLNSTRFGSKTLEGTPT